MITYRLGRTVLLSSAVVLAAVAFAGASPAQITSTINAGKAVVQGDATTTVTDPAEIKADEAATDSTNEAQALAKKLANPVAALISVPFQNNYDGEIGPNKAGDRWTLNIQPVVPISLNANWNLISRTIVPVIWQNHIYPGSGNQTGLGDTTQSFFFSPTRGKIIWGVGPALLLPTGTDALLSTGKWAAGPTGVVLTQQGPITYGVLVNQLWSYAGDSNRRAVNQIYANPFFSYTTKKATTYGLSADITHDWKADSWVVPLTASLGQLTRIGGQMVSFTGGLRYYVATTDNSPHGFGARLSITLLFPKK
jgi:hypothetical protein